ncbi:MAG TPA: DNA helicase RecQ [Saprospiraceae bacterium]|nr:DNA helicase RecQ [Saprospiraceae bacterium]
MNQPVVDLQDALREYFGFNQFKDEQEAIIQTVIDGRDSLVIMPTGGGKSLCYQLPALIMEGTAIIISPLIALMKNQVDAIRGYSEGDVIAHFLNSSLGRKEIAQVKEDIVSGHTKLLYVAPETLTKEENLDFFSSVNISFVAVDEAHCISEWGHDFRPEYRNIRAMIDRIGHKLPVIALTATATPKVQTDIVKSLDMRDERKFVSSFNRPNLYYEVRPKINKDQTIKEILQILKGQGSPSAIIYVQARKTTEEISEVLRLNGISSAPYHAGMDSKSRASVQDAFLGEDIKVICATIAFGMGIDKPDVRCVIHYDIPKSIENYYQETGRGGRDGLEGTCYSFYAPKDIYKLEKFLRDKPVAEREMGGQLLEEVVAYAETSGCRRKFLLHYFGEEYDDSNCGGKCDNCRYPKEKHEVKNEVKTALEVVMKLKEGYSTKVIVDFLMGKSSKEMTEYEFSKLEGYGSGMEKGDIFWYSILRQALLAGLLEKEIENYGVLKVTPAGKAYIQKPKSLKIPINRDFSQETNANDDAPTKMVALDEVLVAHLEELRKREAKKKGVPTWAVFQDVSLQEMATNYPVSMEELSNISGVSMGKAQKYGKTFVEAIKKYVEDNEIERPADFIVRQVANKSRTKVQIIQSIDRKMPLEDIQRTNNLKWDELLEELDIIVSSGTKLDIQYCLEAVDESIQDEIYEYFMNAKSDSFNEAYHALKDDDITPEEIQLVRIKFLSDIAN